MSQCVVICGMHRTGSSFISRLFHEWGVYLGENLDIEDPANPEGEYENKDFVQLNNILLHARGGSWNHPVMVDEPDIRAKALVEKHQRPLWGWKDNRTAFTFKAYEPFLENVLFVVCKRKKRSVVKSLQRTHQGQFSEEFRNPEYYGTLYDQYYAAIDFVSQGYPRIVINYEDLAGSTFFNPDLRHF